MDTNEQEAAASPPPHAAAAADTPANSSANSPTEPPPITEQTGPGFEGMGTNGAITISEDQVRLALRRVKDPDLQLNIVDLGLVYDVRIDGSVVTVDTTLTSPGCPSGPEIFGNMEQEVGKVPGVSQVVVNLIWTPFWTPDRIEPRVRAYLGL